ncbi:hypothetical protein KIN20_031089 [Parelaphostrongylus tenuis]|uniref:Secreted protein n=1 Tax=Parelaphostrongylus tenuis TaxID=148309 RepID=A0AAD5R4Z9_PARTN|nr:hypothetical protein KIN20_031089 [Parelaphostrongylus tenuis]
MARLLAYISITVVVSITAEFGCGVMPPARSRNFTVSGFALPVSMVYSEMPNVRAMVSGSAADRGAAQAFVSRLVLQTVIDVLERQARTALLPDTVISTILSQLTIQVSYDPLECKGASVNQQPTMAKDNYIANVTRCALRVIAPPDALRLKHRLCFIRAFRKDDGCRPQKEHVTGIFIDTNALLVSIE